MDEAQGPGQVASASSQNVSLTSQLTPVHNWKPTAWCQGTCTQVTYPESLNLVHSKGSNPQLLNHKASVRLIDHLLSTSYLILKQVLYKIKLYYCLFGTPILLKCLKAAVDAAFDLSLHVNATTIVQQPLYKCYVTQQKVVKCI